MEKEIQSRYHNYIEKNDSKVNTRDVSEVTATTFFSRPDDTVMAKLEYRMFLGYYALVQKKSAGRITSVAVYVSVNMKLPTFCEPCLMYAAFWIFGTIRA